MPVIGRITLVVSFLSLACFQSPTLPKGETYRTIDDTMVLKVHSQSVLDYKEQNIGPLEARYSIEEDDRVRVVVDMLGVAAVVYFDVHPRGLVAQDGKVLYSTEHFAAASEEYYCAALETDLQNLLAKQADHFRRSGSYLINSGGRKLVRDVPRITRRIDGIPENYIIVLASHNDCSRALLFVGTTEQSEFLAHEEASTKFEDLAKQAALERTRLEEERLKSLETKNLRLRASILGRWRLVYYAARGRKGGPPDWEEVLELKDDGTYQMNESRGSWLIRNDGQLVLSSSTGSAVDEVERDGDMLVLVDRRKGVYRYAPLPD